MKSLGIVGFGRFGELLANLSTGQFDIFIVEPKPQRRAAAKSAGHKVIAFRSLGRMDFIVLAVPISNLEEVVKQLAPLVNQNQVVMDVCSVKVYPARLMKKHLGKAQLLATHPLFGPDSAKNGVSGLQVALCPINIQPANLELIKQFWQESGAQVIETTPQKHDRDCAYSQAFTYSIAKVILGMKLPRLTLKTKSSADIKDIAALSANDSEQLFHDILFYNPYFKHMKKELERSLIKTKERLDEIETEQARTKLFK